MKFYCLLFSLWFENQTIKKWAFHSRNQWSRISQAIPLKTNTTFPQKMISSIIFFVVAAICIVRSEWVEFLYFTWSKSFQIISLRLMKIIPFSFQEHIKMSKTQQISISKSKMRATNLLSLTFIKCGTNNANRLCRIWKAPNDRSLENSWCCGWIWMIMKTSPGKDMALMAHQHTSL